MKVSTEFPAHFDLDRVEVVGHVQGPQTRSYEYDGKIMQRKIPDGGVREIILSSHACSKAIARNEDGEVVSFDGEIADSKHGKWTEKNTPKKLTLLIDGTPDEWPGGGVNVRAICDDGTQHEVGIFDVTD